MAVQSARLDVLVPQAPSRASDGRLLRQRKQAPTTYRRTDTCTGEGDGEPARTAARARSGDRGGVGDGLRISALFAPYFVSKVRFSTRSVQYVQVLPTIVLGTLSANQVPCLLKSISCRLVPPF